MPFSIKKFNEDLQSEKCIKELQNLEKCNNKNKKNDCDFIQDADCTDLFNFWIKCNETDAIQVVKNNFREKDN